MISIIKNDTTQAMIEMINGFNPAAKPMATPAREEWANASPEAESLLKTAVEPTSGIEIPKRIPTTKAMRMNS
jgi:hypothetical protein